MKWILQLLFLPFIIAYDISNLKPLYYQMYANDIASIVQHNSTCVISSFSIPKHNNFIEFIFQGIGHNKTINKFLGEMKQEKSSGCFMMHTPYYNAHNNHYICLIDYHRHFDWIIFGNLGGSALFGLVNNRTSESQKNELYTSMLKVSNGSQIITYNITKCDMFVPIS